MFAFLTADQNVPFTVALVVMFGIALLEGITMFFGVALSNVVDALLPEPPEVDIAVDVSLDAGIDGVEVQSPNALSRLLGWLRIGQVPVLMLIVIFLTGFGLIGLGLQALTHNTMGFLWPPAVAAGAVLVMSLPVVRVFVGLLARVLPKDETDAVSVDSLVGRIATITIGEATVGRPAEARVRDMHGTTHYLMVEPDSRDASFSTGDQVLLLQRDGSVFKAIANPNPALVDQEHT